MNRRRNRTPITEFSRVLCYFIASCLMLVAFSCQNRPEKSDKNNKVLIIDGAGFLIPHESEQLQIFLNDMAFEREIDLVYCSQLNSAKLNVDSIAGKEFDRLWLSEKGVLVFLSKGNSTVKLLVGKKIHEKISDEELTEITSELLPYFKQKDFLGGIKRAFDRINGKL